MLYILLIFFPFIYSGDILLSRIPGYVIKIITGLALILMRYLLKEISLPF